MSKEIQYADLIGVPFKNLGRDVKSGLDCYGLVVEIYRRCGKKSVSIIRTVQIKPESMRY